jgi:hypothetical protein
MDFCMDRISADDVARLTTFCAVVIGTTSTGNDSYQEVTATGSTIAIKRVPDAGARSREATDG